MNKVITINLGGNAYQLEEAGYTALAAYLDKARASLVDNPDAAEIMRDLEQAIGEKCARFLSPAKSVVTAEEVTGIIKEMGPVSGAPEEGAAEEQRPTPKKLYRIREGAWIGGVAAGIAAYFDVDPLLIRALFVVLLIMTSGGFIFAYVLGMVFIPPATTSEERAAAFGVPFTTEEFVRRARTEYESWHTRHKAWRRKAKKMERQVRANYTRNPYYQPPGPWGPIAGILNALVWLVVVLAAIWLYHHEPIAHDFMYRIGQAFSQLFADLDMLIRSHT